MSSLAKRLFGPTRYLESGISFTVFFLVSLMAALGLALMYSPGAGILLATFAAAGFLITLESAIIMPHFFLQYHNAQLFVLFVINLVFFQILANAAWWTVARKSHLHEIGWTEA